MAVRIRITRSALVPDPIRLALYARAPELGPRVLFFSGGTALRRLSQQILAYTHNSVHLITPFDSGGSSAKLREAFRMPAVGDLRNRIMALADRSVHGAPETYDLFAHRLSKQAPQDELRAQLDAMIRGRTPLVAAVPDPMRKIIRTHLGFFADEMTDAFDLRGASIGNLILAGGYFNYKRHLDPVLFLFSKLVEARGTVRPVVNRDLHLAVELEDGTQLVGQHLITGKEGAPIASPVRRIWLTRGRGGSEPAVCAIREKVRALILGANLICYPMGSFWTSVVANLLPGGVGDAIRRTQCPKIYIPNLGRDPELAGLGLAGQVRALFQVLEAGCAEPASRESLLNFVLLDSEAAGISKAEIDRVRRFGVEVIDARLADAEDPTQHDPDLVARHLLSLV